MSGAQHQRKGNGVNKFRDDCRKLVRECQHPELTVTGKLVLFRLIDYTHHIARTAWPSFTRLAEDVGVARCTVIRAINIARQIGLLQRTHRGGKSWRGSTSNRYTFDLAPVPRSGSAPDTTSVAPEVVARQHRSGSAPAHQVVAGVRPDLLKDLTKTLGAASASGLRAVVGSAQEEGKKAAGEKEGESLTSDSQASEHAAGPEKPRLDMDAFRADMARRGVDMNQSRWKR
jgi:Helix-turn-helix domain